jgi:hypothetical protein
MISRRALVVIWGWQVATEVSDSPRSDSDSGKAMECAGQFRSMERGRLRLPSTGFTLSIQVYRVQSPLKRRK